MQIDLKMFLLRLAGTIALALTPLVLTTFVTMPSAFHHHLGVASTAAHVPAEHMS